MILYSLNLALLALGGYLSGKFLKWLESINEELSRPLSVWFDHADRTDPLPSILSAPTKALSIVIPAYNEEERLPATLDEVLAYLVKRRDRQGPRFTYEVIIVDDGSKDSTVKAAQAYVAKHGSDTVRVLRLPANKGKGHAVRRGMMVARGEYCLMMDADGATRFTDLELLETRLSELVAPGGGGLPVATTLSAPSGGAGASAPLGAAFGSRAHLQHSATVQRTKIRNFLMHGFHLLVVFVAGGRIRDTQCGFKLFTRRAAALLYTNQRLQRWCFDVELVYLCERLHIPLAEVYVHWTEMPGSKLRVTSIVHMALELLLLKMAYQLLGRYKVQPVLPAAPS